jgi:hypothetical protein
MTEAQWIEYVSSVATDEVLAMMGTKPFGPASICEAIVRTVLVMKREEGILND